MDEALPQSLPQLPPEADPLEARELIASLSGQPGFMLLDVRTPEEHEQLSLGGDELIDIYDYSFMERIQALPREGSYLIYCRTGNRSGLACEMMRRMGFSSVCNLLGGIKMWSERGLPVVSGED